MLWLQSMIRYSSNKGKKGMLKIFSKMSSSCAHCVSRFLFKTYLIIRVITCSKDKVHVLFSLSAPMWYREVYLYIKYHQAVLRWFWWPKWSLQISIMAISEKKIACRVLILFSFNAFSNICRKNLGLRRTYSLCKFSIKNILNMNKILHHKSGHFKKN